MTERVYALEGDMAMSLRRIAEALEALAAPARERAIARKQRLDRDIKHYSTVQPGRGCEMTEQDFRDILHQRLVERRLLLKLHPWLAEDE